MTVESLFAPVYRAAVRQGIDLAWLDAQPPHVVRWALYEPEEGSTEDDFEHVKERLRERGIEV